MCMGGEPLMDVIIWHFCGFRTHPDGAPNSVNLSKKNFKSSKSMLTVVSLM